MSERLTHDLASLKIDRNAPAPPSVLRKVVVWLLVLAALGAAALLLVQKLSPQVFKQQVSITEVAMISPAQASVLVTSTGYVVPQLWSKVNAKVSGRLAEVRVREGDTVKAGQVIAILDDADQRAAIATAASRVAAARARGNTARANLAEVNVQLARTKSLVESGAIGRAQLEDLQARATALGESVKASDAEAAATQSETDAQRVLLKDRTVTAPFDGIVVGKPANVGELVGPMNTGVGPSIAEVIDFNSIVVETDVPEARLDLVKVSAPAEIVLDAYPTRRYRGVTVDIGKRINRSKGTAIVKVKFKDTLDGVLQDMSARVSFLRDEIKEEALKEKAKKVVAADAVTTRGGSKVVFVVDGGKLKMTNVSVGETLGSSVELLEGPAAGARIVNHPTPELADGQRIKEAEK